LHSLAVSHGASAWRRAMPRKVKSSRASVPVLHCLNKNAAGVDVGGSEVYVAVPPDRDSQPVRRFSSFTEDFHAATNWLKNCRVDTVAMESTGVYWIPLFQILEARGFKVLLVNARHVKNVPGRKSDVADCQWVQYLHSVGLLRGSFRPEQLVCSQMNCWLPTQSGRHAYLDVPPRKKRLQSRRSLYVRCLKGFLNPLVRLQRCLQ
jgi:transposase